MLNRRQFFKEIFRLIASSLKSLKRAFLKMIKFIISEL